MPSFSPIRPNALGNNLYHRTLSKALEMMAKILQENPDAQISKALSNSYNEPSFNEWCAPLAGNPQWCALLLFLCLWLV
jgi:hypothetical protein